MNKAGLRRQIQIINNAKNPAFIPGDLGLIGELILQRTRPDGGWQVRVILVQDREIIALNRRFFKLESSTDVISFNINEAKASVLEGEIYICIDTALRQAGEYGVSLTEELQRLTAHGIYHLLGHEDGDAQQKQAMTRLEDEALHGLKKLGMKKAADMQ